MAVITFNIKNDSISILVEKTDQVNIQDKDIVKIYKGKHYPIGKVLINGEIETFIIRGERE